MAGLRSAPSACRDVKSSSSNRAIGCPHATEVLRANPLRCACASSVHSERCVTRLTSRGDPDSRGRVAAPSPTPRTGRGPRPAIQLSSVTESAEPAASKARTEKASSGPRHESVEGVEASRLRRCGRGRDGHPRDGRTPVGRRSRPGLVLTSAATRHGASDAGSPRVTADFGPLRFRVGALQAVVSRETGKARRDSANAEEATVVVRRHGCQRGERFEGCERAAGTRVWVPGGLRTLGSHRDRNAANPVRQWDATSPRPTARLKPSRWCETTRTALVGRLAATDASWRMDSPAGKGPATRMPPSSSDDSGGWVLAEPSQRRRRRSAIPSRMALSTVSGPAKSGRRKGVYADESQGRQVAATAATSATTGSLRVRARLGGRMRCSTEQPRIPGSGNLRGRLQQCRTDEGARSEGQRAATESGVFR